MAESFHDSDLICEYCSAAFDRADHAPQLLSVCGHNLCATCIEELGQARGVGRIMCPFCRQPHRLGEIMLNKVLLHSLPKGSDTESGCGDDTAATPESPRSDTYDENRAMEYKWFEEGGNWWYTDSSLDRRWHFFGKWEDYDDDYEDNTDAGGGSESPGWSDRRQQGESCVDGDSVALDAVPSYG
ncbi:hypothetical protein FOZ63_019571 [Perkinsus olseni]|uniref:RING-type domain-containing protein n=1 Tax=Perkinsus olseni TaxID=32597 RepID=A0A7J6STJ2_PEROL|nr:hypothetical protein FOZ62_029884 [Perkinsus olseni]KAF4735882.1 hypothetical protein FOZ63_019571 [Perkinsus olseni]